MGTPMRLSKVLLLLLLIQLPTITNAAIFVGLGDLAGGAFSSEAFAISADGTVVVGRSRTFDGTEPFRWTLSGGMVGLGHLGGGNNLDVAYAVSADGSVIVGYGGGHAFRWTLSTGMTQAATGTAAYAVSANGTLTAGYIANIGNTSAFGPNGVIGLGVAWGTSSDGTIVVGETPITGDNLAFRWTQTTGMVTIGSGIANAISADGSTIVGVRPGFPINGTNGYAFRWTEATGMVDLPGIPNGAYAEAYAVSGDGSVVVGRSAVPHFVSSDAFIWSATLGSRNLKDYLSTDLGLNLTGWKLAEARGVSADGLSIVGIGTNPNGQTEAWLARFDAPVPAVVPEPSTFVMFSILGISCLVMGRSRRRLKHL